MSLDLPIEPPTGDEDELIANLRLRAGGIGRLIGDDAAILPPVGPSAVTTDSQIEDTHFPSWLPPADIARRLMAVNASDMAAIGAEPRFAFVALASRPEFDHQQFFGGLLDACREHRIELAGGDLASQPRTHAVMTLIGVAFDRWLRRDHGRAGDTLWLGGTVGQSALGLHLTRHGARYADGRVDLGQLKLPTGLSAPDRWTAAELEAATAAVQRHLQPTAQLELSKWLASQRRCAAIDVSDGVARDLHRLCRASGVGAEVNADTLPRARGFDRWCKRLELDAQQLALSGGEDYVLLFALPEASQPPADFRCHQIGRLHGGSDLRLLSAGQSTPLTADGWDHLS